MRVTRTVRNDSRAALVEQVRRMPDGCRLAFLDPEESDAQQGLRKALCEEMARRLDWHGSRLSAGDWDMMIFASLKVARVVPGLDEGTCVILGEKSGRLSVEESSHFIECARAAAAERGVILGD